MNLKNSDLISVRFFQSYPIFFDSFYWNTIKKFSPSFPKIHWKLHYNNDNVICNFRGVFCANKTHVNWSGYSIELGHPIIINYHYFVITISKSNRKVGRSFFGFMENFHKISKNNLRKHGIQLKTHVGKS
jgi:hypothetical protein